MKSAARCLLRLSLLIFTGIVGAGCGERTTATAVPVVWPELERFDTVLAEAENLVSSGDSLELLKRRNAFLEAGWAVAPASVPANVADMEKVRPLLGDLVSKLNGLAVPSLDPVKLNEIIVATRPILNELFEASGVERP